MNVHLGSEEPCLIQSLIKHKSFRMRMVRGICVRGLRPAQGSEPTPFGYPRIRQKWAIRTISDPIRRGKGPRAIAPSRVQSTA
jgi:hypothetical protein